jgi:diaminohydroxyphosphoribosylaminopyrimidine deaminase/5-amino-6-(5-phosphoribosylamino)uracil reductase
MPDLRKTLTVATLHDPELDCFHMRRALELARRGEGFVEPNPMVGCVIARNATVLSHGWHAQYGADHAEVAAIAAAGSQDLSDATLYVTLEPCAHHGKTPPCVDAILRAGLRRVVVGMIDPFPRVAGQGVERLRQAGVEVAVGVLQAEAKRLTAPYRRLIEQRRPWVIGKWAMTLDGKIATSTGDSRWISNALSRESVHQLRGRMDAILVGIRTALRDDPLLTARPPGPRIATRIVLDSQAQLSVSSQLVASAKDAPLLVAIGVEASDERRYVLEQAGCEVLLCPGSTDVERIESLLAELGNRHLTNLLVEGGGHVLGRFFDARAMDEVHVFISPRLMGGRQAVVPVLGQGLESMQNLGKLSDVVVETLDGDIYVRGRVAE